MYYCDGKAEFSASLVSHDTSEISLILLKKHFFLTLKKKTIVEIMIHCFFRIISWIDKQIYLCPHSKNTGLF